MSSKSSLERIIQLLDAFEISMKDLLLASTAPGLSHAMVIYYGKQQSSVCTWPRGL